MQQQESERQLMEQQQESERQLQQQQESRRQLMEQESERQLQQQQESKQQLMEQESRRQLQQQQESREQLELREQQLMDRERQLMEQQQESREQWELREQQLMDRERQLMEQQQESREQLELREQQLMDRERQLMEQQQESREQWELREQQLMERERQLMEQQESRWQLERQLQQQERRRQLERQFEQQQESRRQLKRQRLWEQQQESRRQLERQVGLLFFGARPERARLSALPFSPDRPQSAPPSLPAPLELNRLPDELLALILSWVPGRALVTRCRLVCRRWRDLIDGPTVWRLQGERWPRLGAILVAARLCPSPQWSRIGLLEPFGRNLVRNPCGQDQFSHWQVEHGGNGWNVEGNLCPVEGAPAQTCFVSSFQWCVKSQMVDLLEEGLWEELLDNYQPEIYISDWWGARQGAGGVYSICVKLLAANRTTVIAEFQANPDRLEQSNDSQYHQVSYRFRQYGRGVRYVHFLHKGKDILFWRGHYGARITNSTVMVKLN
ncbi:F-box only protein 17-like [Chrysemys picta bellii]|uniref:F-box only protein 17-like n=1 Tax=Chrysemys picta bellii TaxID=8478 RepID=UPI0032B14635